MARGSRTHDGADAHHGLVVVDKPKGLTSHDVVSRVRRLAGTRKVGHAGTLDPMATGVLVVGINKATRLLTFIVGTGKEYEATLRLGQRTVTDDAESEVVEERIAAAVTPESFEEAAAAFRGEIEQVPSSVSAIKVKGQRAYDMVRKGEEVELAARPVTISELEVLDFRKSSTAKTIDVDIRVRCSSGTYIRALARDIGEALGVGAHLTALRRTEVGPYTLQQARTLEDLADEFSFVPLDDAARALLPNRSLTEAETVELGFGRRIPASGWEGPTAAVAPSGEVVAIVEDRAGAAKSLVVFRPGEAA
ncbi:tRNA pseudouridine(55) synthase TruB [Falsarthrobacter nasiphocae]|uniref:tRNA pseudouridine synthase B n=1 Tax=Falsarthrobacter nasiphocae TaxID=189863 RepID=A0AAE3YF32_9MICC|nr:tRNA pseudouridine(55) synthase TruB [Falsarthrobacter nasiphocae]MDR6892653.1 tRNA pseudouridine55 synthase [Falsarthrobacter nasiphocae]